MNYTKTFTLTGMALLLGSSCLLPVHAEEVSSEKQEVIYIMTDSTGKVRDVEAVNIFKGGNITDYGDYTDVRMLNTTDAITQDNDKITFSSSADKVYYQGTLASNTSIPWNIAIRYELDGKEVSPEKLAGKSGKLKIHFTISKNDAYEGNFYDNYALQAAFTMNGDECDNIVADDATVANVGNNKQLSYTILPGKGIDTVISADVKDFEMSSVSINAVRLNLNVDIDESQLTDKVDEIVSAIQKLDDGASSLKDGTSSLSTATSTLNDKVQQLNNGVGTLNNGTASLYSGLSTLNGKSEQLVNGAETAYAGLCTAAETSLNSQLTANGMAAVSLTPSTYSDVLMNLLQQMSADTVYQQAYASAEAEIRQQVNAQADTLYAGYIQSQADTIYASYVASIADSLYETVAKQAVTAQLMQSGYTAAQAEVFLGTEQGQALIADTVSKLTDDQKAQIQANAVAQLSDDQKAQILSGALSSLTDEQKQEITEAYVQQMMASDEVTSKINEAVATVSNEAEQISALKGQLDSFGTFCNGLKEYTGAVSSLTAGAGTLSNGMNSLYVNTSVLQSSVSELNDGVSKLYDGSKELADGTSEFSDKTADMDTQISDQIDEMTSSLTGSDEDSVSFVSEKNTDVDSVQFVIKTDAVEKPDTSAVTSTEEKQMTFMEKLLHLFGLDK